MPGSRGILTCGQRYQCAGCGETIEVERFRGGRVKRLCRVSIEGAGEKHVVEVEAESVFEAASAGVERWAKLWWFDGEGVITVQTGEQS
jgi:hypothetical protein